MQNGRGITANHLGIALAFVGIAFGLVPPGLEAVGYPLGPTGGYALLSLAALCGIGAVTAFFWSPIKAAWSRVRRDAELQQLNAKLEASEKERERLEKELEKTRSQQVVDAKALWFGIPTTEIAQERYTRLLSEPVHPKVENQQLGTEIPQRDNEHLKQQCIELSGKLFQFSEMRKKEDPRNTLGWKPGNPFSEDPESRKRAQQQKSYDDETWTRYRRQYEGELRALLDAMEQRGHCNPKERKEVENELVIFWRTPAERVERVAARLDALGKRL